MTEIKLTKRYPQSRAEDITDAFMRGYEQGKNDGLKVGKQIVLGAFETYINADRKTENSSEIPNNYEPKICDNCRYYNSNIPCGSTPSACKKADKFAEEFVDALKKLKPKDEPTISKMEQVDKGDAYFLELMGAVERGEISDAGANQAWYEYINHKDEPQTDCPKTCPSIDICTKDDTDCVWK